MVDQKKHDHEAITETWYLFRDYGDIRPETSTDEKWKEIHDRAKTTAAKFPEFYGIIGSALNALEDRSIGEANAKERHLEMQRDREETRKVMSLYWSLGQDDREKILDMMRLYRNRS